MITRIELSEEAKALLVRLGAFPQEMLAAISRGMDRGLGLLTGQITRDRFTGKGPFPVSERRLGVRTNRLRASLRWNRTGRPGARSGGEASAIVGNSVQGSIGTNVEYMAAHEFGFSGTVQVKGFRRRVSASQFTKAGTGVDVSKLKTKKAREAALGTEEVRPHSRKVNIPERAPIRTGIEEHKGILTGEITAALRKAWEGQKG